MRLLRGLADSMTDTHAVKSTEEMLRTFEDYYRGKIDTSKDKVAFSMDVKNFYPSIDPVKAASVARIMWEKSPLVIENVNYDMLARYLSKRMTRDEIIKEGISQVLYKRKMKKKAMKRKMKHTN